VVTFLRAFSENRLFEKYFYAVFPMNSMFLVVRRLTIIFSVK